MSYKEKQKEKAHKAFDRQARTYDSGYKSFIGKHIRRSFDSIIETLGKISFSSVLDVGCGTGLLLQRIVARWPDARISGIDISPEMIMVARKRLGETADLVAGDAEELPWRKGQFDVVISTNSFHHYPRPGRALAEMKRVLKNDGHLILSDVTAPAPLRQIFNLFLPLSPEGDVKVYSKSEILILLGDASFKMKAWKRLSLWLYIVIATPEH